MPRSRRDPLRQDIRLLAEIASNVDGGAENPPRCTGPPYYLKMLATRVHRCGPLPPPADYPPITAIPVFTTGLSTELSLFLSENTNFREFRHKRSQFIGGTTELMITSPDTILSDPVFRKVKRLRVNTARNSIHRLHSRGGKPPSARSILRRVKDAQHRVGVVPYVQWSAAIASFSPT